MIEFEDLEESIPYKKIYDYYLKSKELNQKNIEALLVASYSKEKDEVDARYVNLKFIKKNKFIFFSNYNSTKAVQFKKHPQITAVIYWNKISLQIRMKAIIKKTSNKFNQKYFTDRLEEKNALAISSDQSKPIESYGQVKENYNNALKNDDLKKCPEYWGGYSFIPYYFEFWEGHESRVNKREVFNNIDGIWKHSFLQP